MSNYHLVIMYCLLLMLLLAAAVVDVVVCRCLSLFVVVVVVVVVDSLPSACLSSPLSCYFGAEEVSIASLDFSEGAFDAEDESKRPENWEKVKSVRIQRLEHEERKAGKEEFQILARRAEREAEVGASEAH